MSLESCSQALSLGCWSIQCIFLVVNWAIFFTDYFFVAIDIFMIIMVHLARLQYEEIFIDLNIISRKTRLVSEMSLRCEPERMIDTSAHKIVDGTLDRRKNWTLFVDDFSYFGPISGCLQLCPVKWFCSRTHKSQSIKPSKSTDLSERRQLSSRTQPSKWAECEGSFYHFSFPPFFSLIWYLNLQTFVLLKSCHSPVSL